MAIPYQILLLILFIQSMNGFVIADTAHRDEAPRRDSPDPVILQGHTDDVRTVAFSPDGRFLVSGSLDHTLRVWDVESGTNIQTLRGHTAAVNAVVYSHDGRYIASGGSDHTIRIWDTRTWSNVRTLSGHGHSVYSVAYSPDDRFILTAGLDETVRIWQADTGVLLDTLTHHPGWILSALYSPDGQSIVTAGTDGRVLILNSETRMVSATLVGHSASIEAASYSSDGRFIASASRDQRVKIWELPSGSVASIFAEHSSRVHSVHFSEDGRLVVSACAESIILWNRATATRAQTIASGTSPISVARPAPNGGMIAAGTLDGTIRIWTIDQALAPALPNGIVTSVGDDELMIELQGQWEIVPGTTAIITRSVHIGDREVLLNIARVSAISFAHIDDRTLVACKIENRTDTIQTHFVATFAVPASAGSE